MDGRTPPRLLAIGAGVVLVFVALAMTPTEAAHAYPLPAPEAAASSDDAVRQVVEALGEPYAGDCRTTQSPRDIGRACSKFVAQRGPLQAYLVGSTFSEFSLWIFVEQTPAGWQPAGTAPLDPAAMDMQVPWPAPAGAGGSG